MKHEKNMAKQLIYPIIDNLSSKIRRYQIILERTIVNLIPIYKKDLFDIKIEIYHQIIRLFLKDTYNNKYLLKKFPDLHFEN